MTELEQVVAETILVDTHEHLKSEADYVERGPDVLRDLFHNYVQADLVVAGATPEAAQRVGDPNDKDVAGRWAGVAKAWQMCRHTGYGEAVRIIAEHVYGMKEITLPGIEAAEEKNRQMRQPGQRRKILEERAKLDSTQTDSFMWRARLDESGKDFFLYDLSIMHLFQGTFVPEELGAEVNLEITNLDSLRHAIIKLFDQSPLAIAAKTQHAYRRTLAWRECGDEEAAGLLAKLRGLPKGEGLAPAERIRLGDWCGERAVEQAVARDLPIKIHTGYYAGFGRFEPEWMRAGQLCPLLTKFPNARFVLMHTAYPYSDELVAMAKEYPNVWVDLCWVWAINPAATMDCVRKLIHAVPRNKVFAFGGDCNWPNQAYAYSVQARRWLARALQREVSEGLLTEREAIAIADAWMRENQYEFFDLKAKRAQLANMK